MYNFLPDQVSSPPHTPPALSLPNPTVLMIPFSRPQISLYLCSSEQLQLTGVIMPPGIHFLRPLPRGGRGLGRFPVASLIQQTPDAIILLVCCGLLQRVPQSWGRIDSVL